MITDFIGNKFQYDVSAPKFQTAFAFIKRADLMELPVGWIELDNGVRASVQEYTTFPPAEALYETHDKYFDLQYMVKGEEVVLVAPREGLKTKIAYDPVNDIEFYEEPIADGGAYLKEGYYVILAPEDAHKPRTIAKEAMAVKKIVVKIPV
ncbi:MAG: YhcH/YjgK/YiaL family protein [Spirochaetales bacterium]|nr:YhcH/YjgK/YiaL family protein [Candidatus Physcosoma equi]